jgi:hypothetical protein
MRVGLSSRHRPLQPRRPRVGACREQPGRELSGDGLRHAGGALQGQPRERTEQVSGLPYFVQF